MAYFAEKIACQDVIEKNCSYSQRQSSNRILLNAGGLHNLIAYFFLFVFVHKNFHTFISSIMSVMNQQLSAVSLFLRPDTVLMNQTQANSFFLLKRSQIHIVVYGYFCGVFTLS